MQDRNENSGHSNAYPGTGKKPQVIIRFIDAWHAWPQMQVRIHTINAKENQESSQNSQYSGWGESAAPALQELKKNSAQGSQVHSRAAGA
jgi:hypothetical protein